MRNISVVMNMTLDGVVQGLGRPDEDTRGGFTQGGWGPRHQDEVLMAEMGKGMSKPGDMLFGRRTWQDFAGYWPAQGDNPFTTHMNGVRKYVVSRSLDSVDDWENSVLLKGDGVESVRALREDGGADLAIVGSADLVRSLHAAGLIDTYTLVIHPITLGNGARLFENGAPPVDFELVTCVPTPSGLIIAE
jgi:dihydrofolate reductase